MNKKLAHTTILLFDLLCFVGIWIGYNEFQRIISEVKSQADVIQFGNRVVFLMVGIMMPLIHSVGIVGHFWSDLPKKHQKLVNIGMVIVLIAILGTGIFGSSWIKEHVENAGYDYCRNASGISALARTVVYTKKIACAPIIAAIFFSGIAGGALDWADNHYNLSEKLITGLEKMGDEMDKIAGQAESTLYRGTKGFFRSQGLRIPNY
jgi:uncharacterized membrane protein